MIAHGIDIVEIARIAQMLSDHGERFAERCFTTHERQYADAGGSRRAERYAARFACKEAVFKALGTGWRTGMSWLDVEVFRKPSGQPELRLAGRSAALASEMGLNGWLVSLSHTDSIAMASVIAMRTPRRER